MSLKGMFGLETATDDDDYEEEYDDIDEQEEDDESAAEYEETAAPDFAPTARPAAPQQPATITPFAARQAPEGVMGTFVPCTLDDCAEIVQAMRNGIPVIVNLTKADDASRYRINDFLFGVMAGLGGRSKLISKGVRVFVPANYKIVDAAGRKSKAAHFPFA